MQKLRGQVGFTLIEVIAVLIILSLLVAVAVPRYVALIREAKVAAAQAQVAEMKSTLNLAYARLFVRNGSAPATGVLVLQEALFADGIPENVGTSPDVWNVTLTGSGTSINVTVNNRNGDPQYTAGGTWNMP